MAGGTVRAKNKRDVLMHDRMMIDAAWPEIQKQERRHTNLAGTTLLVADRVGIRIRTPDGTPQR